MSLFTGISIKIELKKSINCMHNLLNYHKPRNSLEGEQNKQSFNLLANHPDEQNINYQ